MFYFVCEAQLLNVGGKAAMYDRAEMSRKQEIAIRKLVDYELTNVKTYFFVEHFRI